MNHKLSLPLLLLLGLSAPSPARSQAWSGIINPTRAIDWSTQSAITFTIPTYTVACTTQPSLTAGSGNAAANTTSIQASIASCDTNHNVVNIPAGTYYVTSIELGGSATHSNLVIRGAGPNSTYLYLTGAACPWYSGGAGVCLADGNARASDNGNLQPGGGQQCNSWSATNGTAGSYPMGSVTNITLTGCSGTPPNNVLLFLDQGNDTSDNGGVVVCDGDSSPSFKCSHNGPGSGNTTGRVISGNGYSQAEAVLVTSVTGSGTGPYTVTFTPNGSGPSVNWFNNIRSAQGPAAWWPTITNTLAQNLGVENLTVDGVNIGSTVANIAIQNCYHCWVRNIRTLNAHMVHVALEQAVQCVVRDSYFYQSQAHGSQSYVVDLEESKGNLIENNIMHQTTNAIMQGGGNSANVIGYNYSIGGQSINYMQGMYLGHNGGNAMDLWEGNNVNGLWNDDWWGTTTLQTLFRNRATGYQTYVSVSNQTYPIDHDTYGRGMNDIGNVLGTTGWHTPATGVYEAYPPNSYTNAQCVVTIYDLGWGNAPCSNDSGDSSDTVVRSTLMRWGNYDTVNNVVRWNATESSPGAVAYISATTTPSSQTLPASFYLPGKPAWWGTMPFPPIGPDVTGGTLGQCTTGTYALNPALSSSQCAGGTFVASDLAGHANPIPAQVCFLNVMGGKTDGSDTTYLSFDANACYYGTGSAGLPPAAPLNLTALVQ